MAGAAEQLGVHYGALRQPLQYCLRPRQAPLQVLNSPLAFLMTSLRA
jgi:hypothetical protein